MADDGSVVVVGNMKRDSGATTAEYSYFFAVKLDAAGEEVWIWQVRYIRSSFRRRGIPNATLRIMTVRLCPD